MVQGPCPIMPLTPLERPAMSTSRNSSMHLQKGHACVVGWGWVRRGWGEGEVSLAGMYLIGEWGWVGWCGAGE